MGDGGTEPFSFKLQMANTKQCFAFRDKGVEMSTRFMGLAGGYGNDGEIISLKIAVNISQHVVCWR